MIVIIKWITHVKSNNRNDKENILSVVIITRRPDAKKSKIYDSNNIIVMWKVIIRNSLEIYDSKYSMWKVIIKIYGSKYSK
jgi:hypothetical protein